MTAYVDASNMGLGIYFPFERRGFQSPVPANPPKDGIFFSEALAACAAIHLAKDLGGPKCLLIYTDNMNTFDIFNSLAAAPPYNRILMSAVDVIIGSGIDLRVVWIPGEENAVADALSRFKNHLLAVAYPRLRVEPFKPPQDGLGAAKK